MKDKPRIVSLQELMRNYPHKEIPENFNPTYYVEVRNPYDKSLIRADYVRVETGPNISRAFGPFDEKPLYGILKNNLWKSLHTYGKISVEEIQFIPDYIFQRERLGVVYFIQAGEKGPIKIGWSQEVDKRIATLQTANACKLTLLGTVPGTMETERAYHQKFSHLRLEAEWFQYSQEILDFISEISTS